MQGHFSAESAESGPVFTLPEVDPEDVLLVAVLLEDGFETLLEAVDGGLACAEQGEAGQLGRKVGG